MSNSSENMNESDHIINVCPEQVSIQTSPSRQSSSSSNDIVVIPMDESSVCMEDTANNVRYLEAAAISSDETRQCRLCHEDDFVRNLEAPCACAGTLRYAHRSCTTAWCNTKGNIVCEICEQPYGPDYSVTEASSSPQTRLVLDSPSNSSPSTPTTITQVQSPLQQPERRIPDLSPWAPVLVPCRGLLYATLLVLFLVVLIVNDVFTATKTTRKELGKAFNIVFVVIMMLLIPISFMQCIYDCKCGSKWRRGTEEAETRRHKAEHLAPDPRENVEASSAAADSDDFVSFVL